jgi:hypothetical protein
VISRVDVAGLRGQAALVSYVRATAVVAVVDVVVIGTGLAVLGVPLAVPLAALVFIGAFIRAMIKRAFPKLTLAPPRHFNDQGPERFLWDGPTA